MIKYQTRSLRGSLIFTVPIHMNDVEKTLDDHFSHRRVKVISVEGVITLVAGQVAQSRLDAP